jgi:hypothetical protein
MATTLYTSTIVAGENRADLGLGERWRRSTPLP